jgi:ribosome-associated protein
MADVQITRSVAVPEEELEVQFARSGGPGGQHANTSSTKVELRFDLDASRALSDGQKARIRSRLGKRITKEGVLVLQSSEYRSQTRNREAVLARFANLLREALRPTKQRKKTRPTRASKERRLEAKRRTAQKKALRQTPQA